MAGATFEVESNNDEVQGLVNQLEKKLGDLTPALQDIGEYLQIAHAQRFKDQVSPDGNAWEPLSPSYQRRKKKNRNRILFADGNLANSLRYQIGNNELKFGTNLPYAAIHQFGGEINIAARSQKMYFKQNKDGTVGNRFTKKDKSNFEQWGTRGAHKIKIPARPFLGTSSADNEEILQLLTEHLQL